MEWTVVTVIVVLIGLIAAVAKPLISLNTTITKLDTTLNFMQKQYDENRVGNDAEHLAIWDRCDEEDAKLNNHEVRISVLEKGA